MTNKISRFYSLILLVLLIVIAFSANNIWPNFFSDENIFLKEYIAAPVLGTMGFIVSITLAGINSLYVNLQRLGKEQNRSFSNTKKSLKASAFTLIFAFTATVVLVVFKHSFLGAGNSAIFNILGLILIYMNISVLIDVTDTALNLPDS